MAHEENRGQEAHESTDGNASDPRLVSDILPSYLEQLRTAWELGEGEVPKCRDDFRGVLDFIKHKYAHHERLGVRPSAYFIDWPSIFTPIESAAWSSIRYSGLPMLPQYPIGPYFADFADPDTKVVIECDGRQFHQDKERDAARDLYMAQRGWTVFRVTGRECKAPEIEWDVYSELMADGETEKARRLVEDWSLHTAEGVISAIGMYYYGKHMRSVDMYLAEETLRLHCTTRKGARRA